MCHLSGPHGRLEGNGHTTAEWPSAIVAVPLEDLSYLSVIICLSQVGLGVAETHWPVSPLSPPLDLARNSAGQPDHGPARRCSQCHRQPGSGPAAAPDRSAPRANVTLPAGPPSHGTGPCGVVAGHAFIFLTPIRGSLSCQVVGLAALKGLELVAAFGRAA